MNNKKYDVAVVIGRFQPFHLGHKVIIDKAAAIADTVVVLIGSAYKPRTPKDPFTADERIGMIEREYAGSNVDLRIRPIRDFEYQETRWLREAQEIVERSAEGRKRIAILGYKKDESSYYLEKFPAWDFIDITGYAKAGGHPIDATKIRELMFEGHYNYLQGTMTPGMYENIIKFVGTDAYKYVLDEYKHYKIYKKQFEGLQYAPYFNTVDAVVLQAAHILLVRRKAAPGKGLWALPGGFLDHNETQVQSVLRELREETKLKIPEKILRANITHEHTFDKPGRSLRGRTITQGFLIELPGGEDGKLPKVKGSDDAAEAQWFPVSTVINEMSEYLFEDHWSIIHYMTDQAK